MKLLKIKLKGAIGIFKGLGKEEIEVDFTQFNAGLIALTGKNGSGKTTLLENLHPYRCMVSRTGSLQSHFFLKDSFRILEFEHNGNNYESKILIDALTGGSEAYLLQNGQPMNDGKLTTYDEAIESVLGSQELFFNSVFSGQKSKGIAELKASERRKLFYELLNLNVYEKYLEEAKGKLKTNELKLSEIEGKISALQTDEDVTIIDLEKSKSDVQEQISATEKEIEALEEKIENFSEEIKSLEADKIRLEERQKEHAEIERKLENISEQIEEITEALNEKVTGYNLEIEKINSSIHAKEKLLGNQDELNQKLLEFYELQQKLDNFKFDKDSVNDQLVKLQAELHERTGKISAKKEKLSELKTSRDSVKSSIEKYEAEIQRNEENVALINDVPCDETTGASCQFLKNAYESKKLIPEVQQELNELKEKYHEIDAEYCVLDDEINADEAQSQEIVERIDFLKSSLNDLAAGIDEINRSIIDLDPENIKLQLTEIETAEAEIEKLNAEKKRFESLVDAERRNYDEQIKRIQKEAGELQVKLVPDIEKKMLDVLNRISQYDNLIKETDKELAATVGKLQTQKDIIASIERDIELLKSNEEKIKELEAEKDSVQNEIKDWTFLAKAFDKTGIPVLKLENSGVQITAIANELLSLFENQFRIVFETTQLTKDKKKMKETFNINIISGDDVVEISNLSGGQQVWVETAIQLAISLLVREQGINIETSFLDEKDGALDIENAHLYLQMLKLAHQKSGVHNTFVITHRPELIDLIPQKITLTDGLLTTESNSQSFNEVA